MHTEGLQKGSCRACKAVCQGCKEPCVLYAFALPRSEIADLQITDYTLHVADFGSLVQLREFRGTPSLSFTSVHQPWPPSWRDPGRQHAVALSQAGVRCASGQYDAILCILHRARWCDSVYFTESRVLRITDYGLQATDWSQCGRDMILRL